MISQWTWNLRLELGHQLHPDPVRTVSRLLQPCHHRTSKPPRLQPMSRLHRDMPHRPPPPPGRRIASLAQTFLFSPMARCGAQQGTCWSPMSDVEKRMAVYGSSIPPAFATAARVCYVNSANGMATRPKSRARSASSYIHSWSGMDRSSGETGAEECIGAPVCNSFLTSASR